MEDRKAPLIKAVFSDLDRIKAKSLGLDLQMKKGDETFEKVGHELPLMTKGKRADRVTL